MWRATSQTRRKINGRSSVPGSFKCSPRSAITLSPPYSSFSQYSLLLVIIQVRKETALPPSKIERTVWAHRHRHLYLKTKTTTDFFFCWPPRLLSLFLMSADWYIALRCCCPSFFFYDRAQPRYFPFSKEREQKKPIRLVGRERDKRDDKSAAADIAQVTHLKMSSSSSTPADD